MERNLDAAQPAGTTAETTLHKLTVSTATMKRLLERRDANGALVPADAALIREAIATTRSEIRRLSESLTLIPHDATNPNGAKTSDLLAATAKLHDALISIEDVLRSLGA